VFAAADGMIDVDYEAAFDHVAIFAQVLIAQCGKSRHARTLQRIGNFPAVTLIGQAAANARLTWRLAGATLRLAALT
jgi:hypothetical protein